MGLPLFLGKLRQALKRRLAGADIRHIMMISDEQVRRAVEYLKSYERPDEGPLAPLRDDAVVLRAIQAALSAPDVRPDRLAQASYVAHGFLPDADSVAEKLIGRIISDLVR